MFVPENNIHTILSMKIKIFHIYALHGMHQILHNFVFMHNTAIQKLYFFVFMGISKFHSKITSIHAQSPEKFWLISYSCKIGAKNYLFRINEQFRAKRVSYWYENDAEFRAKKSFREKPPNCCTRELNVLWKPYTLPTLEWYPGNPNLISVPWKP